MPNVYDARINRSTVGEIVYKHNRLVDLLGKDLSSVVQGGGVGDVRSPAVPGATDGNVPLWDGTSGKLLKNSNIDGDWFNQDVKTTAGVEFSSVSTRQVYAWAPTDSDYALSLASPTEQAGVWVEVSDAASTLDMWVFDENDGGPNVKALSANLVTGETTLHALDVSTTLTINGTPVLTSAMIDDTAYGVSWNGDTTHAPTKNAIYDKIEGMGGASVSDEEYGATWDGVTDVAPSKNAVYDAISGLPATHDAVTIASPANGLSVTGQELSIATASTSTTGALSDTDWDTFNGKQDALTFGIADTNAVKIDSASVADDEYARFTASGLEGRSYAEVLSDIGAATSVHAHDSLTNSNTGDPVVKLWTGTQAEYDAIGTGNYDATTLYTITDVGSTFETMVDDTAYASSWDGDTTHAPSKNAVYDKIESLGTGGAPVTIWGYM